MDFVLNFPACSSLGLFVNNLKTSFEFPASVENISVHLLEYVFQEGGPRVGEVRGVTTLYRLHKNAACFSDPPDRVNTFLAAVPTSM